MARTKSTSAPVDRPGRTGIQRPPAEELHHDELAALRADDAGPRPPGFALSLPAIRSFVLGDEARGIRRKMVCPPSLIERAMVTLATTRGLLLVGEPGTAKSLLSELLAAAISGISTLTIQGGASLTEDHITYSWNYALLVSEGPSRRALVPAPLHVGMSRGLVVRFEEITRCPLEVQDALLSILSERVLAVPELEGEDGMVFARDGFNVIATANTRDRGVNEMSSALKRRFSFETVFPIADRDEELALVREESTRLLARSGVPAPVDGDVLDVLVTTFRELRSASADDGSGMERLSTAMSTAEAVSLAHAVGVRGWFLRGDAGQPSDIVECLAGTAAKDSAEDLRKIRRYLDQRVAGRPGDAWQALHAARHLLPG